MQPLGNCIGPTIRIGREILCLPYAGFFFHLHPSTVSSILRLDKENNQTFKFLARIIFYFRVRYSFSCLAALLCLFLLV